MAANPAAVYAQITLGLEARYMGQNKNWCIVNHPEYGWIEEWCLYYLDHNHITLEGTFLSIIEDENEIYTVRKRHQKTIPDFAKGSV